MEEIEERDKKTILIVDDEKPIVEILVYNLQKEGYNTLEANDGLTAVEIATTKKPDLILLDINIPYINGEKLLQDLRKTSNIPVIMVTSRNSEIDEALSISYGADDYITKPYNPNILLLRIGAVLKRTNAKSNVLSYKDLKINVQKGIIKKEDVEIILTKNEIIIFCFLLNHQNKIVTRDELMTDLWNNDEFINDNALTVNISRLRAKLKSVGYEDAIDTRKGMGYILL